ncbi:hypothetical protein FRB90_004472 [Tulasnella sp. 427]|nr:hypothetical protein FRB90_004472 [Tulasnella sp. 427]
MGVSPEALAAPITKIQSALSPYPSPSSPFDQMPYRIQDEELLHILRRQASDSTALPTTTTPEPTPTPTSATETTTTPTPTTTSTSNTSSTTPTSSSVTTTSTPSTSSAPASSSEASSSNAPTSQAQSTSMVATTAVVVTNGSTVTTVTATQTIISETHSANKSSNTGAIVGGVVGGIGGLALLIVLFWLIRRKTKKVELEGDIFDPDRNVQRPGRLDGNFDLAEPQMLAHPYNYQPATTGGGGGAAAAAAGGVAAGAGIAGIGANRYSQHRQSSVAPGELYPHNQYPYGQSPYPPAAGGRPQSAYLNQGPADVSRGPSDGSAYGGMAPSEGYPHSGITSPLSGPGGSSDGGAPPQGAGYLAAFPAGVTQYTSSTSSSAAAKAQQAAAGRGLHVANDDGPVMQHQDGGRAPHDTPSPPTEVPPAYDSIPREEAGPSGAGPSVGDEAREAAARPEKSPRPLSN